MNLQPLTDYPDPAIADVARVCAGHLDRVGVQLLHLEVALVHRDARAEQRRRARAERERLSHVMERAV